ncbi:hypothetical protein L208DRAFT_1280597 [Tricholoma matsutake]|nr:hypothetical protein L208DRAFT_1280597 [Tricholoma matsutake 945]
MPWRTNPHPICQHYLRDLKKRVVYQAYTLQKSTAEIAVDINIPLRAVQCVLKVWREIGEVCMDRRHMGHAPMMGTQAVNFMLALLDWDPDMYLDEIQAQLEDQHGIEVSLATISQTLKWLGILSKAAFEHCVDARRDFVLQIGNEPLEQLVAADEAAVNILTSYQEKDGLEKDYKLGNKLVLYEVPSA